MSTPSRPAVAWNRPESTQRRVTTRSLVIGALLVVAAFAGAFMDVGLLVVSLGLCNVAVFVFLLLKRDIAWGFLFYLTAVIFFQQGFWIRLPGFPDLYPGRVALVLLYLVFVVQILLRMRHTPRLGRIEKTMLVFLVLLYISALTRGDTPGWLLLMRGYLFPFLFFYFARAAIAEKTQVQIVMAYLVLVGLYFGVMGILEGLKLYEFVFPKFIVDPTVADKGLSRLGFRVRGIFLQPAVLGCVMTIGFFPAWFYLGRLRGVVPRILQVALLVVTPPTLFYTLTRSVYLGFAAALVVAAIWSRRMRTVSVGLILGAMVAIFLNWDSLGSEDRERGGMGTMNTVHIRIELLYEAVEIFADNPLFGCGFMNFPEVALEHRKPRDVPLFGHVDVGAGGDAVLHNMILTVLAEQGLTGLVPYMLIYFFVFMVSLRAYRDLPREGLVSRDFVVCVWCAMAAYFMNSMFLELRYFEYVNVLYFFLMGTMVGMYERYQNRELDASLLDAEHTEGPRSIPWPTPRSATSREGV